MRTRLIMAIFCALSLSCGSSLPKPGEVGLKSISFRMRDFKLASGLRILVQEDHSSPIVGVINVVGVGSTSEPAGKEGMAHLVEHLAFRTRPTKEGLSTMWDLLERSGGAFLNAYTTFDRTVYYEYGAKEALPDLLRLEGARMMNPIARVDEHIIDVEREVVRNELRQGGETRAIGSIFGWVQEAVFPQDSPYHHSVIGTHDSLSSIKLADIQKFARMHYRLDNMTMMIIGDVDLATIDKTLADAVPYLAGDPKSPVTPAAHRLPAAAPEPPAPPPNQGMRTYEGYVSSPEIWMGWSLPGGFRDDSEFMEFVNQVLNAELSDAAGEGDRDIADIVAGLETGTRASLLFCQVKLKEGKHPEKSAEHVLNQLVTIWAPEQRYAGPDNPLQQGGSFGTSNQSSLGTRDKFMAIIFNKMRLEAATGLALDAEDMRRRAPAVAEFAHFTGDPAMFSRILKAMAQMEEARIAGFASKYLKRERARIVYVKPLPPSARVPKGGSGVGATDESSEVPFNYDVGAIPQLAHSAGLSEQLRTVKLKNGLEVVIGRRPAMPLVTVALGLRSGRAEAQPFGAADLAVYVSRAGSHRHGNYTDYGARAGRFMRLDQVLVEFKAGAGNLPNMLAILSDQVRSMRVNQGATGDFKKWVAPILKKEEEQPDKKADRAFWKALYGEHPYGRRATVADLEKLDEGTVEKWLKRVFSPRNATLVIVGDIDPSQAEKLAREWLQDWEADGGEVPAPPAARLGEVAVQFEDKTKLQTPPEERVLIVHRPGATQGELRLGCLLPAADQKSAVMYDVMADMVSKQLFRAVRQRLGASYGVYGRATTLRGGSSHLIISGNINNDRLGKALHVIREYWDGLPAGKFGEQDMNKARWGLARDYNLRFTTTELIASEVLGTRNVGWDIATLDKYPQLLAAVTKGEMQKAFGVCHDNQLLMIVGDEPTVRAALKEGWK